MTRQPRSAPRRATIPPFYPVPVGGRRDGWTPLRQAEFIGHLAECGSVAEAARRTGMAREGAYRLRTRCWSESLCAAWQAALARHGTRSAAPPHTGPRKVTLDELYWRLEGGLWQVRLDRGRYAGVMRKADSSALLGLLARLGGGGPLTPARRRGS